MNAPTAPIAYEDLQRHIADLLDSRFAYIGISPMDVAGEIISMITGKETNEKCIVCGAKIQKYHHHLNKVLAQALIKVSRAVSMKAQQKPFTEANDIKIDKLPEDMALTHIERCNFVKLRFHALVAKVYEDGERREGRWLITAKGWAFLRGEAVPESVETFRNTVIGHSENLTTLREVLSSAEYSDTIQTLDKELASLPGDLR